MMPVLNGTAMGDERDIGDTASGIGGSMCFFCLDILVTIRAFLAWNGFTCVRRVRLPRKSY